MPLDLARLQAGFRENALTETADGEAAAPADLADAIVADGIAAERRLAIHRNHFAATLVEALGGVFEATRALVGADFFDSFALRFARKTPPATPCLFEYGGGLPAALAAAPGMDAHSFVADVARLEWAMHESFHAPAAPPLSPSRLSALPADQVAAARLTPHPALRLIDADFPVDELWRGARAGEVSPDMLAGPAVKLILTRQGVDVAMERCAPGMYMLLRRLADGAPLGVAAAETAAAIDDFDFGATLGDCLADGVFADELGTTP